jgi:hypothetical protein
MRSCSLGCGKKLNCTELKGHSTVRTPARNPSPQQLTAVLRKYIAKQEVKQSTLAADLNLSTGAVSNFLNDKMIKGKAHSAMVEKFRTYLQIDSEILSAEAYFSEQHGIESAGHCMFIGDNLTLWYSRVGNAVKPISDFDVDLVYNAGRTVQFPNLLERLTSKVLIEQELGKHSFSNNKILTIVGGETSAWKGSNERFHVSLELAATDYAYLYTLRRTSEGKSLLRDYIAGWTPNILFEPTTAQGLGVNVAIISDDDCLIFGRRSRDTGVRRGQLDVGAVEGFNVERDIGKELLGERKRFDLMPIVMEAAQEEFGIGNNNTKFVKILNFGFDLQYAQWNFITLLKSNLTAKEIRNRHRSVASQGVEYEKVTWVSCVNPRLAFEFMANDEMPVWSCGLAAAFYSMVNIHGIDEVERALAGIKFKDPEIFLWD